MLTLAASRIRAKQALEWGLVDQDMKPKILNTALASSADMFIYTAPPAFRESKKLLVPCHELAYEGFLSAYLKG